MKFPKKAGILDDYHSLERILKLAIERNEKTFIDYSLNLLHQSYAGCELWTYRDFNKEAINILFSRKFKLGFIPIPKNACTSLKLLLYKLDFGRDFPFSFLDIHEYFYYPAYEFQDILRFFSGYSICCFLRDPIKRFISGYADKICDKKVLISINDLKNKFYGIGDIEILTSESFILDFLDNLEFYMQISIDLKHHFSPQTSFLQGVNKVEDLIIFFYIPDDLKVFEEWLFEKTQIKLSLPKVNESIIKFEISNKEIIDKIKNIYEKDYLFIKRLKNIQT